MCNDGAIQSMDVMKSEAWTRRHLAPGTLTSELAGYDIIKAILPRCRVLIKNKYIYIT